MQWLDDQPLTRNDPFDASTCPNASLADLDADRISWFIERARQVSGFPLPVNGYSTELITHLNLLDHDQPVYAVMMPFVTGTGTADMIRR